MNKVVKCFINSTFPSIYYYIYLLRLLSTNTQRDRKRETWLHCTILCSVKTHWNEHLTILIMPFYWLYIDDNGFWMEFLLTIFELFLLEWKCIRILAKHNEKWKFYWCCWKNLSFRISFFFAVRKFFLRYSAGSSSEIFFLPFVTKIFC